MAWTEQAPVPNPMPHARQSSRGVLDYRSQVHWPPPGWGQGGLIDHARRHRRAMALAKAITRPTSDAADYLASLAKLLAERDGLQTERDQFAARCRELTQWGADLDEAAVALRTAAAAVLASPIGTATTREIPTQRALYEPEREAG